MRCFAYEGGSLKLLYLLWYSVFNDEPGVVARYDCSLRLIGEGGDIECGGGVYLFGVDVDMKFIVSFEFGLRFGFHQPVHLNKIINDQGLLYRSRMVFFWIDLCSQCMSK